MRKLVILAFLVAIAHSVASQTLPTPDELSGAIYKGDPNAVKRLLTNGAPVRTVNRDGFAPLVSAVMLGASADKHLHALEIVKLLVEADADIEQQGPQGNTPLAAAAGVGNSPDIVEYLLNNGANVNVRGYGGTTALYQSVRSKKAQIAELLILHGANVNAKTDDGWTPLHFAATNGMEATTKLLIDKGVNVNSKDAEGKTSLAWARGNISRNCMQCRSLATPALLELLVRNGATE